ncbi:phosphotransferase [Niabella beijingensis]|uniref:phosphotransferase n=1 Tax=Niabella beijingensis TaxID=2872700 RepID=UPI001CBD0114|nr:phosphotransferase [Niabella beijingensis]MBZ4187763.1 phosphotransferase [Niabella beijingensis]
MSSNNTMKPPEYLRELVEDRLRKKAVEWTIPECGLSAAYRFSVTFTDHSSVFVKAATDAPTSDWLRREHLVLSSVEAPFLPRLIDWIDIPGTDPVLLTQDLSGAYWPAGALGVHWRPGDMERLFQGLNSVAACSALPGLPALGNGPLCCWPGIAADPGSFLALRLCTEHWFRKAVDVLTAAEPLADRSGDQLVHGDVRSDNICFVGDQVVFVDWSHAAGGNADADLALLLPTLHLEGGPLPSEIMPGGGNISAAQCSQHFMRLQQDHLMPPWLKTVFIKLIAITLEWAADGLELGKPDGISWHSL